MDERSVNQLNFLIYKRFMVVFNSGRYRGYLKMDYKKKYNEIKSKEKLVTDIDNNRMDAVS